MNCYQELRKECNPRKCNKQCYIKDNHRFQSLVFSNDSDIQQNANNYFIDCFIVESKKLLPRIQEETFNHYRIFPNARAYKIIEKTIENIDYGLVEQNSQLVKKYKEEREKRKRKR